MKKRPDGQGRTRQRRDKTRQGQRLQAEVEGGLWAVLARVKLCWQASASRGRIACSAVACRCIQLVTCTQRESSLSTLQQQGNCDHSGPAPTPRLTRRSWWAALLTRPLLMLSRARLCSPAPRDRHRTTHAPHMASRLDPIDWTSIPASRSCPEVYRHQLCTWTGTGVGEVPVAVPCRSIQPVVAKET